MGLPYGDNFMILSSTVFVQITRVTDGQRAAKPICYMLPRAKKYQKPSSTRWHVPTDVFITIYISGPPTNILNQTASWYLPGEASVSVATLHQYYILAACLSTYVVRVNVITVGEQTGSLPTVDVQCQRMTVPKMPPALYLIILSIHPSPTHPPAWKIFEFYESNLKFHNKPNLASLLKILQKLRCTQCDIKALLNGIGNHLKLVINIATVHTVLDAVTYSLQNLSALTTITIVRHSNIFINAITDKTTKLKINIYGNWQQMHDACCITQTA